MTRIKLFSLILVASLLTACDKSNDEIQTEQIKIVQAPFLQDGKVPGQPVIYFDATGNTVEIDFNSTSPWKAEVKDPSWCVLSTTGGKPGRIRLRVSVAANPSDKSRETTLTLSNRVDKMDIAIQQAAVINGVLTE